MSLCYIPSLPFFPYSFVGMTQDQKLKALHCLAYCSTFLLGNHTLANTRTSLMGISPMTFLSAVPQVCNGLSVPRDHCSELYLNFLFLIFLSLVFIHSALLHIILQDTFSTHILEGKKFTIERGHWQAHPCTEDTIATVRASIPSWM